MSFFRIFQHLLPDAAAWRLTIAKTLRSFFEGLAGGPEDAVAFVDDVYGDLNPETTRELVEWEKQFGLQPNGDEATRRLALAAEWAANGGQSPSYIQGVLHTAGFTNLFVHEWWSSGPPYVARDPRDYTEQPLIGSHQCTGNDGFGYPFSSQPQCSAFASQPQCNGWLANEVGYLVNKDLTRRAPPPVPDDSDRWPYFWYVGAETFPEIASVDADLRPELERLLLKLGPSHLWIVTLIAYIEDEESLILTEGSDFLTDENEDLLEA
jgi:hypothetical protein